MYIGLIGLLCTFSILFRFRHSRFSPLALDFSFDIRRHDTHPRRVRARRRAPHDDSVNFLTLGHRPYLIRRRAACRQQYHLEVRPLLFPTYLPRRVEYLSRTNFALRIKTTRLASPRGQGTAAQFPLLSLCVPSTDRPMTLRAC